MDLGTKDNSSVDYPVFAHRLSRKIKNNDGKLGILICGSGIGMDITANKHKNVRAALCYNVKSTRLSREHNNANVMAIGSRLTKKNIALKCVNTFLNTKFMFSITFCHLISGYRMFFFLVLILIIIKIVRKPLFS